MARFVWTVAFLFLLTLSIHAQPAPTSDFPINERLSMELLQFQQGGGEMSFLGSSSISILLPSTDFQADGLSIYFYGIRRGERTKIDRVAFENEEQLNRALKVLNESPRVDVTTMVFNQMAAVQDNVPKLNPSTRVLLVEQDYTLVEREPTAEEVAQRTQYLEALNKNVTEQLAAIDASPLTDEEKVAERSLLNTNAEEIREFVNSRKYFEPQYQAREYLGSLAYPGTEVTRQPLKISLPPLRQIFVFKNAEGNLEFVNEAGTALEINKQWVSGADYAAFIADLQANKADPRNMRFQLTYPEGNIIDSQDPQKRKIIEAQPDMHFAFIYNQPIFGGGYFNYPKTSQMNPEQFMAYLNDQMIQNQNIKLIEAGLEHQDGFQEIINVTRPEAPAAQPAAEPAAEAVDHAQLRQP